MSLSTACGAYRQPPSSFWLLTMKSMALPIQPHSSVDVDEFLFYVRGNFTSRRGVGPGSISYHPAGLPHGPHPGAYEASIGHRETNELAVMLDTVKPLQLTGEALSHEDPDYMESFIE